VRSAAVVSCVQRFIALCGLRFRVYFAITAESCLLICLLLHYMAEPIARA